MSCWIGLALFCLVRLSGPNDFFDGDQSKQVGYILDILHHDHWAIQYETNGDIATKPPLYNWCAASLAKIWGNAPLWIIKLPSLLAGLGLLWIIYLLARKFFDESIACWSVIVAMSAHHILKLAWFARTDMLMVFGVYLAIAVTLLYRFSILKSVIIGVILGLDFLAKGPVGPILYLIWLVLWSWYEGQLQWKYLVRFLPGLCLFIGIVATWLFIVWQDPQFYEAVIKEELGSRFQVMGDRSKPWHYYLPKIIGRVAPWSLVALITVITMRRHSLWPVIRKLGLWAVAFFVFFSLLPGKRHDLLLPVYPPIFILAGLGIAHFCLQYTNFSPIPQWILRGKYALSALIILITMSGLSIAAELSIPLIIIALLVIGLTFVMICCNPPLPKLILMLCFCILLLNGAYAHGLWNPHNLQAYTKMQKFLAPVAKASSNEVMIWKAYPLFSYELRQHRYESALLAEYRETPPKWLIAEKAYLDSLQKATGWEWEELDSLTIPGEHVDVRLLKIRSAKKDSEHE